MNSLFDLSLIKLIGLLFLLNNKEINSAKPPIKGADGKKKIPMYSIFRPTLLKLVPS